MTDEILNILGNIFQNIDAFNRYEAILAVHVNT